MWCRKLSNVEPRGLAYRCQRVLPQDGKGYLVNSPHLSVGVSVSMTFLKYVERGTERVDSLSLLPATIHSKVAATGIARTRNQGLELGRWLLVGRGNGSGRSQMLFRRGVDTRGPCKRETETRYKSQPRDMIPLVSSGHD